MNLPLLLLCLLYFLCEFLVEALLILRIQRILRILRILNIFRILRFLTQHYDVCIMNLFRILRSCFVKEQRTFLSFCYVSFISQGSCWFMRLECINTAFQVDIEPLSISQVHSSYLVPIRVCQNTILQVLDYPSYTMGIVGLCVLNIFLIIFKWTWNYCPMYTFCTQFSLRGRGVKIPYSYLRELLVYASGIQADMEPLFI